MKDYRRLTAGILASFTFLTMGSCKEKENVVSSGDKEISSIEKVETFYTEKQREEKLSVLTEELLKEYNLEFKVYVNKILITGKNVLEDIDYSKLNEAIQHAIYLNPIQEINIDYKNTQVDIRKLYQNFIIIYSYINIGNNALKLMSEIENIKDVTIELIINGDIEKEINEEEYVQLINAVGKNNGYLYLFDFSNEKPSLINLLSRIDRNNIFGNISIFLKDNYEKAINGLQANYFYFQINDNIKNINISNTNNIMLLDYRTNKDSRTNMNITCEDPSLMSFYSDLKGNVIYALNLDSLQYQFSTDRLGMYNLIKSNILNRHDVCIKSDNEKLKLTTSSKGRIIFYNNDNDTTYNSCEEFLNSDEYQEIFDCYEANHQVYLLENAMPIRKRNH